MAAGPDLLTGAKVSGRYFATCGTLSTCSRPENRELSVLAAFNYSSIHAVKSVIHLFFGCNNLLI